MMEVSLYASGMFYCPIAFFLLSEPRCWPTGHDARTRFDMNIRRKEWQLRKAIIVYIGAMSEFTGNILDMYGTSI